MPKNRPNCPHYPPAEISGDPLFTWIVWQDRAPLQSPLELGRVQAHTKPAAESEAAKQWPGLALLVQSAASAKVRPFSAIPLAHEVKRTNAGRGRPHARKQRRTYEQLDALAPRAPHAARRSEPQP